MVWTSVGTELPLGTETAPNNPPAGASDSKIDVKITKKEERHEIKLIKEYTDKHVHSLKSLADAFQLYMTDLHDLQTETFIIMPSDEDN